MGFRERAREWVFRGKGGREWEGIEGGSGREQERALSGKSNQNIMSTAIMFENANFVPFFIFSQLHPIHTGLLHKFWTRL